MIYCCLITLVWGFFSYYGSIFVTKSLEKAFWVEVGMSRSTCFGGCFILCKRAFFSLSGFIFFFFYRRKRAGCIILTPRYKFIINIKFITNENFYFLLKPSKRLIAVEMNCILERILPISSKVYLHFERALANHNIRSRVSPIAICLWRKRNIFKRIMC